VQGAIRSTLTTLTPVMRVLLGLLGAGSFGTGVYALFVTENDVGTGVLLAFGGVLIVLALLGNRLESVELGGAKLRLQAAERYVRADEAERAGDPATADRLRAEAQALLEAAGPIADEYRWLRGTMPSGARRTTAMTRLVERARRLAEEREFDPVEVARWLRDGTDEQRVTALAMMQARRELRDADALLAAVREPRSPFEHYLALELALAMLDDLDPARRSRLADILTVHRTSGTFATGPDRRLLSTAILNRLAS
jgi:hypothetical protein